MTANRTLGQRIKEARDAQALSQGDVARRVRVKQQTVSRWESDKEVPSRQTLNRLARFMEIPPEEVKALRADALAKRTDNGVLDRLDSIDRQLKALVREIRKATEE